MVKRAAIAMLVTGCTAGEAAPPEPTPDAGPIDTPAGAASLRITATTSPTTAPNQYAPRNVAAIWIESSGTFVKTIDRRANVRKPHLVAWTAAAGATDTDAVTGATRADHATPLSITWDLKDKTGNVIQDGTYTVRMEVADENATLTTQDNEGTFTFVKGSAPQNQSGLSNGGFTNVSIDFTP